MMTDEKKMISISTYISKKHAKIIKDHAITLGLPHSRIAAMIIDNAITSGTPLDYDLSCTDRDESGEFAEEGGIFLDYLKGLNRGLSLDAIISLRHDMGIEDKNILLKVFNECLFNKVIEKVKPNHSNFKYRDDYWYYRIAREKDHETHRKRKNRAKEYDQYLKLKKIYDKE